MDSKLTARDILRLRTQEKGLIYIRDALSFYLMDVRVRHNFYNKTIIVLSMLTAFFETLNAEFEWSSSCSRNPDVSESVDSVISPFTFDKEAYTFDDSDITFDRG